MLRSLIRTRDTILFAALIILGGCSKSDDGKAKPEAAAETGGVAKTSWTIGMSQCNLGEPWRVQMNADLKAAADKHPELTVVFKDAQNDTLKQRSHVEEFVSSGVDLIIISPKEAQPLTEPVAKAIEADIPVIVLDRALNGDKFTMFIGADNVAIGRAAGKWIAEHINADAQIVELKGCLLYTSDAADE